ncbi:MAG TPA: class I SAM-dependent methyltransferase [Candidatus Sulfomarinibacteraceae bacterium]|nr:class I SAM-dependent methyltransferase [Candidatus Sulfomarinibacteraceae bacterium]
MGASPSTKHAAERDALAGRLFEAMLGAFDLLAVQLGLELGLYRAFADSGPATARELAGRARIDGRYAREWLEQQAVTGILTVDDTTAPPDERRYALPSGHAEALLDADSPAAAHPMPQFVASGARMLPALVEAYRTGAGLAWDAYPGLVEAQEGVNRPVFRNLLTQEWLPAIPDVHARLLDRGRPARVADLACGAGWSTIAMAKAYPWADVVGLDIDRESIERARRNAAAEGLAEPAVRFHLVDAGQHDLDGRFDLVTIFEAVHDLARPVEVLTAVRHLLAPDGVAIVVDEKVAEHFTAPGDSVERVMYGYSLVFCLANGLADRPSVGTGAVMRPETFRRYALEAGLERFSILPIEHETFRFYRLEVEVEVEGGPDG